MTSLIQDAASDYRHRAKEARAKATAATDEATRKSLLQDADTWERMARYEDQHNPQRHLWQRPGQE